MEICDETEFGFGWIAPEPDWMERCSHAIVHEGRVWIVDPVDLPGVDERIRALGEPAGVLQLLDRHARDCAALAQRLGVPHHEVPFAGVPDAPFEVLPLVRNRWWKEIALWWPERRVLVAADALGTSPLYLASRDRLAVHPILRLRPPRRLRGLDPEHVLSGHGAGIHGDEAAQALREALATARRRIPGQLAAAVRLGRERRRASG